MRRLAVTAIALHVIASILLLSVMRQPPMGRRRSSVGRSAADIDGERRRLARTRAAIEGNPEPDRPRIPYTSLGPPPDEPAFRFTLPRMPRLRGLPHHRLPQPGRRTRVAVPLGVGFLALLVASTSFVPFVEPEPITARPPTVYEPVAVTGFTTAITVDREPDSPIVMQFSAPMDRLDVEARLAVEPPAAVRTTWDAEATRLTIEAVDGWALGTYYTLTIPAGARDQAGGSLAAPVRAAFLVRGLTGARITASRSLDGLARLGTAFVVTFDRPVDLAAAAGAFSVEPAVSGSFSPASGVGMQLTFMPAAPLAPAAGYLVSLGGGLVDAAGRAVATPEPVLIRTVPHPQVRSTSPAAKSTGVATTTAISVRFSRPMDASTTIPAFSVVIAGAPVAGATALFDGGSLLTFKPAQALPLGAGVGVRIADTATSADGVPLVAGVSFTFKVRTAMGETERAPLVAAPSSAPADSAEQRDQERKADEAAKAAAEKEKASAAAKAKAAKAAAAKARAAKEKAAKAAAAKAAAAKAAREKAAADEKKTAKPAEGKEPADPKSKPKPSAGGSSWVAVEAYYLSLVNCTRTGGWVQKNGKCTGAGSRKVAPLKLDAGISARVARPYAKKLALAGACTHFSGGGPSTRLRRAGFSSPRWAENLSCPPGMTANQTAVYSIRYFQNEKPWNGGHWRNLMNAAYDRVGIGIWAANGRVIIVSDFYRP